MSLRFFAVVFALPLSGGAFAQSLDRLPAARAASPMILNVQAMAKIACHCRAQGVLWDVGKEVCLDLGQGRQAFTCSMDQNVTSWRSTGRSCPES